MTRDEIVAAIADEAGITKKQADTALRTVIDSIMGTLKKGKKVSLVGFGAFSVSKRKARMGRNPKTGEAIKIAATKVPKFTSGKAFKDLVAGR